MIHLYYKWGSKEQFWSHIASFPLDPENLLTKANAYLINDSKIFVFDDSKSPLNNDEPMNKKDNKLTPIIHLPNPQSLQEQVNRDRKIFDGSDFWSKQIIQQTSYLDPSKVAGVKIKRPVSNKKQPKENSVLGQFLSALKEGTDLKSLAIKLNNDKFKSLSFVIDRVHELGYSIRKEGEKFYLVD